MRKFCSYIKDDTLKKYILEDFLSKINKLTPNENSKINYDFSKRKILGCLMKQKKYIYKKRTLQEKI